MIKTEFSFMQKRINEQIHGAVYTYVESPTIN